MTTTGPGLVRDAVPDDAVRCAEIYAPYVRDTAISFETEPPTAADMARRIADAQRDHAWLVLEDGGEVTGYAYGGPQARNPPTTSVARCSPSERSASAARLEV
jgi:L-amino acid N-acyltransferase YncA